MGVAPEVQEDGEVVVGGALALVHLNLTVGDVERSAAFYRRWFAFTAPPRSYPDGTVFLGNDDGFDLALHPGDPPTPPAPTVHFGFRSPDPGPVRALHARLGDAGVPITEHHDTDDHLSVKCLDPDGYEIEVYWEPITAPAPNGGAAPR